MIKNYEEIINSIKKNFKNPRRPYKIISYRYDNANLSYIDVWYKIDDEDDVISFKFKNKKLIKIS